MAEATRTHPALRAGNVAVVTGGASGIGLAAATWFASQGMKVCIVDLGRERLAQAEATLAAAAPGGGASVMAAGADVGSIEALAAVERQVQDRFGGTDVLMNNAGVQPGSALFGSQDAWDTVIRVNLWGVINGSRAFGPGMAARGRPGLIVNTGSKQGITTPPGDPAYNVSKAGVKAFTEALAHELRSTPGCQVSAHLLIPGFVYTALTAKGRDTKPDAAWTPEQVVEFMLPRLATGDFYILCPDNDVTQALDHRRVLWAAGDVVENRPALSRWHPDHAQAFEAFVREGS